MALLTVVPSQVMSRDRLSRMPEFLGHLDAGGPVILAVDQLAAPDRGILAAEFLIAVIAIGMAQAVGGYPVFPGNPTATQDVVIMVFPLRQRPTGVTGATVLSCRKVRSALCPAVLMPTALGLPPFVPT